MSAYQNRPWETTVYLSLAGSPVTGILYTQITVNYKQFGQTAFTTRTLLAADWIELGNGYYTLDWESTFLSTLGPFVYVITGAGLFNQVFGEFDVDPQPVSFLTPPDLCVVTGNITDIGGKPGIHRTVSFRPPEFPVIVGTTVVDADKVYTNPDYMGNFSVALIQGQTVLVEIDRTGIYTQITIPMAPTANLTDLLPL